MKKEVGTVSPEERDEIQNLFERKNGLIELAKILSPENESLYEKLVRDLGVNATLFQNWWNEKSVKYQWESADHGNWEIDFTTCKIYLVTSL